MAKQLIGKNYADMSDKYRSKNTKQEFKEARRGQQRMAGVALSEMKLNNGDVENDYKQNQSQVGPTPALASGPKPTPNSVPTTKKEAKEMVQGGASIRSIDKATQSKEGRDPNAQKYLETQLSKQKKAAYGGPLENFDARAGSAKGKNQISKYDLRQLEAAGHSREDIVKMVENSDASQNARAQKLLGKYKDKIANKQKGEESPAAEVSEGTITRGGGMMGDPHYYTDKEPTPTPTPTAPTPTPTPTAPTPTPTPTPQPPSANAEINNPITSTTGDVNSEQTLSINGDGAMVNQETNIDASSRVYGGDTRIFQYTGGSNSTLDTPVSAATMGGFYDVNDSHAANAARLDRQIGQNQDAQKYWQKDAASIAQDTINNAYAKTSIDPDAIDERLVNSEQDSFDRAALMGANIFGDMAAYGGAPAFKSPKPGEPVENPNFNVNDYINF